MSIELQRFDNLGHKNDLTFVLFKGLNSKVAVEKKHLVRFCGSNSFSLNLSILGVLSLLEYIKFIKYVKGKIHVNETLFNPQKFDANNYFENQHFYNCLFNALDADGVLSILFSHRNIHFDNVSGRFFIKNHLIPFKLHSIRNLLLSLGFFNKYEANDQLIISTRFTLLFERLIEGLKYKKNLTKQDLKESLELRDKLGLEAELFVLEFENKRLKDHPFAKRIKRISDEDVCAGYDIESFSDSFSVFPNRFIEVKSYSESISFFWSRNEVEKAKSLREEYYLYLVDRSKLAEKDYKPKILQDPWSKIMKSDYWLKDTESWKIVYSGL